MLFVRITSCTYVRVGSKHKISEFAGSYAVLLTKGDQHMSQQDQWHAHPSESSMSGGNPYLNTTTGVSSIFVKLVHDKASQSFSSYTRSAETAIPPPPPYLYPQLPSQPKRNIGYLITITVLTLLVVGLGSLEVVQVAANRLLTTYPYGSTGSNQAVITPAQHPTVPLKTASLQTLTPGTIKENSTLTCSVCTDPVLTTINSITIDTTNLRMISVVKLDNKRWAEQIVYFIELCLQDYIVKTYEGRGDLNTDIFVRAGQMAFKTEIFSLLPRPRVSYTLIADFGMSGITYDPLQLTF